MIPYCRGGTYGLTSRIGYGRHHWHTYAGQSEGGKAPTADPFGSHTIGELNKSEISVARTGTPGADGLGVRARAGPSWSAQGVEAPRWQGPRREVISAIPSDEGRRQRGWIGGLSDRVGPARAQRSRRGAARGPPALVG